MRTLVLVLGCCWLGAVHNRAASLEAPRPVESSRPRAVFHVPPAQPPIARTAVCKVRYDLSSLLNDPNALAIVMKAFSTNPVVTISDALGPPIKAARIDRASTMLLAALGNRPECVTQCVLSSEPAKVVDFTDAGGTAHCGAFVGAFGLRDHQCADGSSWIGPVIKILPPEDRASVPRAVVCATAINRLSVPSKHTMSISFAEDVEDVDNPRVHREPQVP